ncbi:MAG: hypothetical protein LUG44_05525 [Clostridiales bacterium]|nr:hypothetical protein [Clostridiales bacterium]
MENRNYAQDGYSLNDEAQVWYDKNRDGKFPDCRFCRYHIYGSRGVRCRYKRCPYRKHNQNRRHKGEK